MVGDVSRPKGGWNRPLRYDEQGEAGVSNFYRTLARRSHAERDTHIAFLSVRPVRHTPVLC